MIASGKWHSFCCGTYVINRPKSIIIIIKNQSRSLATYSCPDVDGLGVRDGWQRVVDGGRLCGHCEEGCHAEGDSGGDGIRIKPEADPRHDHEHAARDVDGEQVVGEFALKCQVDREAAVLACK